MQNYNKKTYRASFFASWGFTWNYLKATDGQLLLSRGVDWCTDFDPTLCAGKIKTYRGENYVNTDGQLLRPWPSPTKRRSTPQK